MRDATQLIEVHVFREVGGRRISVQGANVVLGGGYGRTRTNRDGRAVFIIPANVSAISIYVNGTLRYSGPIYKMPKPFTVLI